MMKPALAVYDVMRRMTCPLITVNTGLTVGIGSLLCAVGTTGKRSEAELLKSIFSGRHNMIHGHTMSHH